MAKISVFVSSKFLHPKAIQNVQHPHPALLGSIRYLRFHPRFPTQFTQLARNWLLIKFSSVTVSPACPTSSNSQLQLPVFSEGCSLAHSMNLHVYQMKPEYKAANSVQHIFTSKTGANNNMSFTFNVLKEMAMPRHTVKCTSTCSAHAAAIAAKSEEPFSTCHGLGLILLGPRFHFRPTKPRFCQEHPWSKTTRCAPWHPQVATINQNKWVGRELNFQNQQKRGKVKIKGCQWSQKKKWDLYQPGKRPRCWFALKTNADARMPKGRLSNCCPNQWTSMTITGFTACICWDPQVFKPIFSKLMLVGDVDGSCGS